jgi:hypothetical protein
MKKRNDGRQSKISFLRGVLRGGRTVDELRTPKYPFLLGYNDRPGVYKELPSGKMWTDADIKNYESRYPNDKVFLMLGTDTEGSNFEKHITKFINGSMNL